MKNKIKVIRKQYKITIKELEEYCDYSYSYLSRLENNQRVLRETHLLNITSGINEILKKRNINQRISIKEILATSQEELDELINKSIIEKSISNIEKQKQIISFGKEHEVHSLKFRYLMGKYNQKKNNKEKALEIYLEILEFFGCSKFFYSVLIETIRLSPLEDVHTLYSKHKISIEKAPLKTKSLILYNIGVSLSSCHKYKKAIIFYEKVINLPRDTKQKHKAYNNMGICFQQLKEFEKAIDFFKKSIVDPTNFSQLRLSYTNIISCSISNGNKILLKITLKKLESILNMVEKKNLYQTYNCIGIANLELNNNKKAIEAFENEISLKIDFSNQLFNIEKYIISIRHLIKLYNNNTLKQQELINKVTHIPQKYSNELILYFAKYLFENNMEYEGKLLIKKINWR